MTQNVEYERFDDTTTTQLSDKSSSDLDLSRLSDIPMGLSVEIGRTHLTVAETLALRVGSVVTLDRLAGEAVDLLVNGTPIARGEVIVVDDKFGLHITELVAGHEISASAGADGGDAPIAAPQLESDRAPAEGSTVLES